MPEPFDISCDDRWLEIASLEDSGILIRVGDEISNSSISLDQSFVTELIDWLNESQKEKGK